jgi:hypothetical protein
MQRGIAGNGAAMNPHTGNGVITMTQHAELKSLRAIANAVLYEGYMLYPYRPSALKNQRPGWSFGTLLPPSYVVANPGEFSFMAGQVLASRVDAAELHIEARFLQLNSQGESIERSVEMETTLANLLDHPVETPFAFSVDVNETQVLGCLKLTAEAVTEDIVKISLWLHNRSRSAKPFPTRDAALQRSLIAAHAIVLAKRTEFISLLDPPEHLQNIVANCRQTGVFPVLTGNQGERTAMLLSPIILYDYPQIAPESRGDFFDSSEIDEMLTLRVLTLTDSEKQEMRMGSPHGRKILERTESTTPEETLKLHGVFRERSATKEEP